MLTMMEPKQDRAFVLTLIGVGLILRLAYFFEYKALLEFLHPTVDALYHHLTATAIASGALTSAEPFFRAPFYSYFLGLIYFFTDDSIAAARLIQLLMGVATPVLTFLVARRIGNRTVGVIASLLTLFCGDIVYFEGELLLESLVVSLTLLAWYTLFRYREKTRASWLALVGLFTGLAIITRPNAAVLAAPFIYLLWSETRDKHKSIPFKPIALYLTAVLIPVAVVLAHNLTRPQPALSIATQGGINFYIGNNRDADAVSAVMPGKLGSNWQYDDIKFVAEQAQRRALTPTQVSSHYYDLAISDIRANPLRWLGLEIKKLYLIFSGVDISNNRNLIAFRAQFHTLKLLPIGMWVLAPFGLVGIAIGWCRSRLLRAVIIFVLLYSLSFVFYFVNSRFRLPILPSLAILAALALTEMFQRARSQSYLRAGYVALPVIALLLFLNANPYRLDFDNRQQAFFSKGNLDLSTGDYGAALDNYYRSLASGPPLPQVYLNIGVAHLHQGEQDSAGFYFNREDSLFDGSAEALNNLAYLSRRKHDYADAIDLARHALRIKPYLEEARLNLAYTYREAGFPDSAYAAMSDFARAHPLTTREQFLLGILASDLRRYDQAATELRDVLGRLAERSQPLYAEASGAPSLRLDLNPQVRIGKVQYNLGYVLGAMGQIDSALVYLNQAVANDPNLVEAWINLGSAHFAKHDINAAKNAFLQAARINSQNEVLMFNLALVSLASDDTTAAVAYLQRCLSISPQFAPAKQLSQKLGDTR